jgi:hypothetical protein
MNTIKCIKGVILQSCFDFIYISVVEEGETYEKRGALIINREAGIFFSRRATTHVTKGGILSLLYRVM